MGSQRKLPVLDAVWSRREALAVVAAGVTLAGCPGPGFLAPDVVGGGDDSALPDVDPVVDAPVDPGDVTPACPAAPVAAGVVADFPVGTWHRVSGVRATGPTVTLIVARDAAGIFAMSGLCTHAGCVLNAPSATGATLCPCHGSRFNGLGAVVNGPASTPLRHFNVVVCGEDVTVDISRVVAVSARTAVG